MKPPAAKRTPLGALLACLLLVAGCGDNSDAERLDPATTHPELFAQDGFLDRLRRRLTPNAYWRGRLAEINADIALDQQRKAQAHAAYQQRLLKRRLDTRAAIERAMAAGEDLREARRRVIEASREELDQLRQASAEAGKRLRERMELLRTAREAMFDAIW